MSDIFNDVLTDAEVYEVSVLAGAVLLSEGKKGHWREVSYSLPENYTEAQAQAFRVRMQGDDTLEVSMVSGTLWLSDNGMLDYDGANDRWVYVPPVPPIPAFPNTGQIADLHNDVVKRYFNLA